MTTNEPGFRYLHAVDRDALAANPDSRYSQRLFDRSAGADQAAVNYIRTPPGDGSPRGMHTHAWEQLFYILDGTMTIEVEGHGDFQAGPGSLVVFPAGVAHRNWNAGDVATVHLAINTPAPPLKDAS
ncbi:MAG TPA: cupin domain-containing protein [Micromonosporaceae bacterium]|nr:cupin domain-containing protein [Micromonosporaceae bacterium]